MHDATAVQPHYDRGTIALHWITAAIVPLMWIIGQTADWIPRGPGQNAVWSIHVTLGFVLAAVILGRMTWRLTGGRRLPHADRGALDLLAKSTHALLYIGLGSVIVLGVLCAFARAYNLFGIANLPQWVSRDMRRPLTEWHGLAANILFFLALFHASAALVHHYVWQDGLMRRMATGRASVAR